MTEVLLECEKICSPELANGCIKSIGETAVLLSSGSELSQQQGIESETGIETRQYQIDAWDAIANSRANGEKSGLVHLATGLGKTTIGVVDALRFINEHNIGIDTNREAYSMPRILFAVHQNEILDQASERFKEFAPEIEQGYFSGSEKHIDAPIVLGTMQSLYENLDSVSDDHFDYIIYDEAHHAKAKTFSEVVQHFKPKYKLALTATPNRMDGLNIRELFGGEIYSKSLAEALTEGWLADVDYHIVIDDAVKEAMESGFEGLSIKAIRELLGNQSRNEKIAHQIRNEIAKLGLENAKTILFCQTIDHAEEMADILGGKAYHSELDSPDREKILKNFKSGGINLIATRDMFNEGVDVPDARLVVFLRSTGSRTIFEQQLGRGLRRTETKSTVSVLDYVANIERLGHLRDFVDDIRSAQGSNDYTKGGESSDTERVNFNSLHGDFDFDKIAVDLLARIDSIRSRGEYLSMTNEEIISLGLSLSPDEPLSMQDVGELSKEGLFPSTATIFDRFGSLVNFQQQCGFDIEEWRIDKTEEEIIAEALSINPDRALYGSEIRELSKTGKFPSESYIAKRFGTLIKFQRACGFDVKDWGSVSDKEIIDLALQLGEGSPLAKKDIEELSKKDLFPSASLIRSRFGGTKQFKIACGYDEEIDWTNSADEDIVAAALSLSPDQPLTQRMVQDASKNGAFPGVRLIMNRFGNLKEFQRACGFEIIDWNDSTNDKIIELARKHSKSDMITLDEIDELSSKKLFPSKKYLVKRFGSMDDFRKAFKA